MCNTRVCISIATGIHGPIDVDAQADEDPSPSWRAQGLWVLSHTALVGVPVSVIPGPRGPLLPRRRKAQGSGGPCRLQRSAGREAHGPERGVEQLTGDEWPVNCSRGERRARFLPGGSEGSVGTRVGPEGARR